MADSKPTKKQLEALAEQINQGQAKASPAEKRVKIDTTFKKAVKRIAQTPPPKKETNRTHFTSPPNSENYPGGWYRQDSLELGGDVEWVQ